MRKAKGFTIGAVIFYAWYIYMSAVYQFVDFLATGKLYSALIITAPLMWLGKEYASGYLFVVAPILFFIVTVIINLLPEFTKVQKIFLTIMPIVSYALLWAMDYIYIAYFSFRALH